MTAGDHLEHVEIMSPHALRAWLTEHHDRQAGVWIVWAKSDKDRTDDAPHRPRG